MDDDFRRARTGAGLLVTSTGMTLIAVGAATVIVGSHWALWVLWAVWVVLAVVTVRVVAQTNRLTAHEN